jgi:hypothetical protein
LDAEDGVPVLAMTAASGTSSFAFFGAECAEESLADRQLGLTQITVRHLGVAYECAQHHEDRGAVTAENRR